MVTWTVSINIHSLVLDLILLGLLVGGVINVVSGALGWERDTNKTNYGAFDVAWGFGELVLLIIFLLT